MTGLAKAAPVGMMRVEQAAALLAQSKDLGEVKGIRDQAQAVQAYLRQRSASEEAQRDAAEIKLLAERRLGELLAQQRGTGNRAGRGRPPKMSHDATFLPTTLEEQGVTRSAASRWGEVARVPEERFERYIKEQREDPAGEITIAGLLREATGKRPNKAMGVNRGEPEADERYTRRGLVEQLHAEFRFTIDAASLPVTPAAQVIGEHWTVEDDGLEESWVGHRVFCNPPWSQLLEWVLKAWASHRDGCDLAVLVFPANRTDQPFWQEHVEPFRDRPGSGLRTRFLPGRESFGSPEDPGGEHAGSPVFGVVLLIFGPVEAAIAAYTRVNPPSRPADADPVAPPAPALCGAKDGSGPACNMPVDHDADRTSYGNGYQHSNGHRTWSGCRFVDCGGVRCRTAAVRNGRCAVHGEPRRRTRPSPVAGDVMAASEFRREAKALGFSERMSGDLKGKQARCLYCDTRIPWRPSKHGDAPAGALEQLRDHRKRCDAQRKAGAKR